MRLYNIGLARLRVALVNADGTCGVSAVVVQPDWTEEKFLECLSQAVCAPASCWAFVRRGRAWLEWFDVGPYAQGQIEPLEWADIADRIVDWGALVLVRPLVIEDDTFYYEVIGDMAMTRDMVQRMFFAWPPSGDDIIVYTQRVVPAKGAVMHIPLVTNVEKAWLIENGKAEKATAVFLAPHAKKTEAIDIAREISLGKKRTMLRYGYTAISV